MDNIFRSYRTYTLVFFNNVIVYSKSIQDYKMHLWEAFQVLRDKKLYINLKRSEFFFEEIQHLVYIISKSCIRIDLEKLDIIKEWPMLRNLHELRSFIGMCAYYHRFIANFSSIARPLHDLIKKIVRFMWTSKQEKVFSILKENLISQPILYYQT